MLPVSRRNSEDSIASALSDAETELKQEDPPWAGDAMAPMSSLELSNLRRFLLGLEQLKASIESALGADYEAEEGGQDKESAESDCSSGGEDGGHAELARASAQIQSALQPCYSSKAQTPIQAAMSHMGDIEPPFVSHVGDIEPHVLPRALV